MTTLPKSITITNHKMWIDGTVCPWYIAEQGPTLEHVDGQLTILTLPIIVFTDECIVTDLRTTDDQGWTETDLKPYLDQLDRYAKELASLTAITSGEGETT